MCHFVLVNNMFHVMIHSQGFIEGMPVFDNVKQLEIRIPHRSGASLDHHVYLLSSFPSVRVLKIKVRKQRIVYVDHACIP